MGKEQKQINCWGLKHLLRTWPMDVPSLHGTPRLSRSDGE